MTQRKNSESGSNKKNCFGKNPAFELNNLYKKEKPSLADNAAYKGFSYF